MDSAARARSARKNFKKSTPEGVPLFNVLVYLRTNHHTFVLITHQVVCKFLRLSLVETRVQDSNLHPF